MRKLYLLFLFPLGMNILFSQDDQPEEVTVIIRGKGYPTQEVDHRYVEIADFMEKWRYQFWLEWNGLDGKGYSQLIKIFLHKYSII